MNELEQKSLQGALDLVTGQTPCSLCKGIRFKTCPACREKPNSFGDFRDGRVKPQTYQTLADWYREGERERETNVPERPLQP